MTYSSPQARTTTTLSKQPNERTHMSQTYQQLVAAFTELMKRGEKDQWKLAETATIAISTGKTAKEFGADTGYAKRTINQYIKAFAYRDGLGERNHAHLTYADAVVMSKYSELKAQAIEILAGATGGALSTTSKDIEQVKLVQDFLIENPELVQAALKDDDARSAVASAAFKAASEDIVAEATGITTKAAREKAPKRNLSQRAVQVEQLKYRASRIGHWAEGNIPSIIRDTVDLAEYMTVEELSFVFDQLGQAHDVISQARTTIDDLRRAKV